VRPAGWTGQRLAATPRRKVTSGDGAAGLPWWEVDQSSPAAAKDGLHLHVLVLRARARARTRARTRTCVRNCRARWPIGLHARPRTPRRVPACDRIPGSCVRRS
jgi:hypothetical protein